MSNVLPAGNNGLGHHHRLRTQVVHLIAEGATNRSIAQQVHLSPHTVKTHVHSAFAKLGIASRVQLAQLMRRSH
jgi:DNA-binding NarL/FixJ family response regulator